MLSEGQLDPDAVTCFRAVEELNREADDNTGICENDPEDLTDMERFEGEEMGYLRTEGILKKVRHC